MSLKYDKIPLDLDSVAKSEFWLYVNSMMNY